MAHEVTWPEILTVRLGVVQRCVLELAHHLRPGIDIWRPEEEMPSGFQNAFDFLDELPGAAYDMLNDFECGDKIEGATGIGKGILEVEGIGFPCITLAPGKFEARLIGLGRRVLNWRHVAD